MIVYIAMLVVVSLLALVTQKRSLADGDWRAHRFSPAAALVAFILISVAALRWRVGADYPTYEVLFPVYVSEAQQGLGLLKEPGIRVLALLAQRIDGDPALMFAFASIITVGLSVRTIWRWSPVFAFSIAIYIFSGSWHGSFNGVRQYLACAILFAGHRFILERKPVHWLAVVFAAFLCHISAVVGLLLYLVPTKRLRISQQLGVVAIAMAGIQGTSTLLTLLEQYNPREVDIVGAYAAVQVNPLRVAFTIMPLVIYWAFPKPRIIDENNAWFYVNMLFVNAATMVASSGSALLARFVIYSQIFVCIGIPYVTALRNDYQRTLVRLLVLSLFALFWYVEVSGIPNLYTYQWIFNRY